MKISEWENYSLIHACSAKTDFGSIAVIMLLFLLQTWVRVYLPFDQVCLLHQAIQQFLNHPVADEESKNKCKEIFTNAVYVGLT